MSVCIDQTDTTMAMAEEKRKNTNQDFLIFDYSYGYDCKRMYNLLVLDEATLLFASGNFLHFFNVNDRKLSLRRSEFGDGIGCIAKNPSSEYPHFVVGESEGIIIYEWPSLNIIKSIQNTLKSSLLSLTYNLNGQLLVSHSGEPDYTCTVFDWSTATVLFKSSSNAPVCKIQFSSYHQNRFTSFGPGNIKFWKISRTFTGDKLEVQEGKFDQTNISNILSAYDMPDNTVLSGCEWGNVLVWKDGYIKVEIERKLNKNCHDAPITQFFFENNELWTVSMDGQIKVWYYKKIDSMKVPDDRRFVSAEPIYKFSMPQIMFLGIHRQDESDLYFVQDGNGGLWKVYLNAVMNDRPPVQLYKCHGGAVVDIGTYPWDDYLFSLGIDGRLQLYSYTKREFLYACQFPAKGCCLLWLPLNVQASGNQLIMGFDDGNLRVVVIDFDNEIACTTIQILKPHKLSIIKITLNETTRVLVSASEDRSIFVHCLKCFESYYATVVPIGYVQLLEVPKCVMWSTQCCHTIVIGGRNGYYANIDLPKEAQSYTEHTFLLREQPRKCVLRHEETGKELKNTLLWILSINSDTWFSMDGSDGGFIYKFNEKKKYDSSYKCCAIYNAKGIVINNCTLSFGKVLLAMGDGSVIIANQANFSESHRIPLHDNRNSFIPKMCFSHDKKYFFTCGHDGNIFSHTVNTRTIQPIAHSRKKTKPPMKVDDYNGYTNFTLEEVKTRKEVDEQLNLAEVRKQVLTARLLELKKCFESAMKRNRALPENQRMTKKELEIHPLITEYFDNELKEQLELVKAQLARKVKKSRIILDKLKKRFIDPLDFFPITVSGIRHKVAVATITQKKLTEEFYDMFRKVEKKMQEEDLSEQWEEGIVIPKQAPVMQNTAIRQRSNRKRDVLLNLSMQELKYGRKINQLLNRYRLRKVKQQKRKKEWGAFKAAKPQKVSLAEDQQELSLAVKSIGDYKLKSSANYKVPKSAQMTVLKKYHQLLSSRLKQFTMIHEYNGKVYRIRGKRVQVIEHLQILKNELENIHDELSDVNKKFAPSILLEENDFPEKNLEVVVIAQEDRPPVTNHIVQTPNKDLLEKEVLIENTDAEEDTEWEIEARNYRKSRKIFEQDAVLHKIQHNIKTFDDEISNLAKEGNEVMRDVDLLDLHMITLNQELIVLKKYEGAENEISEKIRCHIKKLYQFQNNIEKNRVAITSCLEKVQMLSTDGNGLKKQFLASIEGSAHKHHLKSVFDGQEMEMFSSSESSVDSETSENLDEHDQELYEIALDFRKRRSLINEEMKRLKDSVDVLNNEIKSKHTRARRIERDIKLLRCDFDKLQTQKQNELNEIMCTVVLKLDQLQHLNANNTPSKIPDTLIFSPSVLSNLYKKVDQLHNETEIHKSKHKIYFTHLCRMKTDCHLMKEQIKKLQNEIEDSAKKKIGVVVKVDVIEEARLKQKLFEFKLSRTNVKSSFEKQTKKWNDTLKAKQIELKETIKSNSSKMNVLAALHKEKTELVQIVNRQADKRQRLDRVVVVADKCKENIEKLSGIIKHQNQELEVLKNQIKLLSYKSLPRSSAKMSDELFSIHLDIDSSRRESFKFKLWDKEKKELVNEKELMFQPLHTAEVQIPVVLSDEIEEMVQSVVLEMLESLGNASATFKMETSLIIQQIMPNLMAQSNVEDIIVDLANFLPKEFTKIHQDIMEDAAQKIFFLLHPELQLKNIEDSAKELLVEVIEEMARTDEELETVIQKLLLRLVQCLPIKFLTQKESINICISKIEDLLQETEGAILEAVLNISKECSTDVQQVTEKIIEFIGKKKSP